LWNETPSDELKQFMDDIDAAELHPDEAELGGVAGGPTLLKENRTHQDRQGAVFVGYSRVMMSSVVTPA
jgi:hypothetical protein